MKTSNKTTHKRELNQVLFGFVEVRSAVESWNIRRVAGVSPAESKYYGWLRWAAPLNSRGVPGVVVDPLVPGVESSLSVFVWPAKWVPEKLLQLPLVPAAVPAVAPGKSKKSQKQLALAA